MQCFLVHISLTGSTLTMAPMLCFVNRETYRSPYIDKFAWYLI
ncbi:MAG: hypothetical protein K0Q48_3565 [Bacillota bacterium]|nr:hypothetical protein [Bacillota bacterium]